MRAAAGGRRGRGRRRRRCCARGRRAPRPALVDARAAVHAPAAARPRRCPAPPRPARPGLELSPSAVEMYRGCPLRYRFAVIDRVPGARRASRGRSASRRTRPSRPTTAPAAPAATATRWCAGSRSACAARAWPRRPRGARRWRGPASALPDYHDRHVRSRTRPVAVERDFTLTVGPAPRPRPHRPGRRPPGRRPPARRLQDRQAARGGRRAASGDDLVLRLYLLGAREAWGIEPRGATRGPHPRRRHARRAPGRDRRRRGGRGRARRRRGHRGRRASSRASSWACRTCDFARICPAQDR